MIFSCPFLPTLQAIWVELANGVGAPFNTLGKTKLMKNNPAISSTTTLADIDEADFSGYSETVSNDVPFIFFDVQEQKWVLHFSPEVPGIVFTHNAAATTNIVYGIYVVDFAETVLLGVAKFDEPLTMANLDDLIDVGKLEWSLAGGIFQ